MRWLMLLALIVGSAQAQVPTLLMPTPLGTILTVYSYVTKDSKKTYYARVQGQGDTQEQARTNGFRVAVEQAIGPLILSESTGTNGRLQRDQIITYSSGMIDRFNIVEQRNQGRVWLVTMDVWVTPSNIANRLFNESASSQGIDGARLGAQVESVLAERDSGDQVVTAVVRDLGTRGFDIQTGIPVIEFDNQRQVRIKIPMQIDMNYAYAVSLWEAMNRTSQARVQCGFLDQAIHGRESPDCARQKSSQYHFAMAMKPADRWQFWQGQVTFDDARKLQILAQAVAQPWMISATLVDGQGRPVARACQPLEPYMNQIISYDNHRNTLRVQQGRGVTGQIQFNMQQNHADLSRLHTQQVRVVPQSQCNS